jgi:hypothetical protein
MKSLLCWVITQGKPRKILRDKGEREKEGKERERKKGGREVRRERENMEGGR